MTDAPFSDLADPNASPELSAPPLALPSVLETKASASQPSPIVSPLQAFEQVLASLEALRHAPAFALLLGGFASAALLLSSAQASLARGAQTLGVAQALGALLLAFYGGNASGLLLMDQARGIRGAAARDARDALGDALRGAHRLLLLLLAALALVLSVAALMGLLLWLPRADVLGERWGAPLFGTVVPVAVVVLGSLLLGVSAVFAPVAAAAHWCGMGSRATLRLLWAQGPGRLLYVAMLTTAAALLAAAVAALVAAVLVGGTRVVGLATVLITGLDIPPGQLMAGFFGHGLRQLGAAGAPVARSAYGAWALTGGGVVFAVGLVLPALVYLRGLCAVLLVIHPQAPADPDVGG